MNERMYEDCVLQSMRFPQKLWRIVNECKSGAISWGEDGGTILLDYKRFQAEYLDTRRPIFKTNNITSFIRQLNLYGFRKVTYGRDSSGCDSCDPHVHEFLHSSFRADRADLLANVCRKAGRSRCAQHEAASAAERNPRAEETEEIGEKKARAEERPRSVASRVSRLKLCQLALTKTLEQIAREYRREHEERKSIVTRDCLKRIRNSQEDTVPVLYEIEFSNAPNRKPIVERSARYSAFVPIKTDASSECKAIPSPWRNALNKRGVRFNVQN
ncbi:PREDICTED: heat shock factor protein 2-like [Vollenhovia emeryi]|uniref:heat shock factor protein 2-like n=1 Tax=Vollenhovia emeryi TaxID=411798 RepID=UPI0005F45939|nr:PREDICTED: heat shock factor protein 2-like [Vollenhovia emeryi]